MIVRCFCWTVNLEWNRAVEDPVGDGFELTWPQFGAGRREPLVSFGEIGKGELLYVKYPRERAVAFGYDQRACEGRDRADRSGAGGRRWLGRGWWCLTAWPVNFTPACRSR